MYSICYTWVFMRTILPVSYSFVKQFLLHSAQPLQHCPFLSFFNSLRITKNTATASTVIIITSAILPPSLPLVCCLADINNICVNTSLGSLSINDTRSHLQCILKLAVCQARLAGFLYVYYNSKCPKQRNFGKPIWHYSFEQIRQERIASAKRIPWVSNL